VVGVPPPPGASFGSHKTLDVGVEPQPLRGQATAEGGHEMRINVHFEGERRRSECIFGGVFIISTPAEKNIPLHVQVGMTIGVIGFNPVSLCEAGWVFLWKISAMT